FESLPRDPGTHDVESTQFGRSRIHSFRRRKPLIRLLCGRPASNPLRDPAKTVPQKSRRLSLTTTNDGFARRGNIVIGHMSGTTHSSDFASPTQTHNPSEHTDCTKCN